MSNAHTPIAVVGMGCLLPGASNPDEFWQALLDGADHRTDGGRDVFGTDPATPGGWGDAEHHVTATRGGFVTEPEIDLTGLRVPADRLDALGPVVRWPIHVVRQALADAGIAGPSPVLDRTGLVLGNYSFPTGQSTELCVPLVRRAVSEGLRAAGLDVPADEPDWSPAVPPESLWPSGLPANVLGDALGLGGPRLALDAACSSALYSVGLAAGYLATGAADVMLAGAVCAPDPLLIHLCFSDLQAFPGNGVSQPFHPRSSGIVTGQGAGVVVLKRLADAVRDGDRIHAVIESIGLSNDGAGTHLLSPNVQGQLAAYRLAYGDGVDPVDYIECHATGTPVGDPTELRGLTEFFGDRVPLLGSVKGNVGHLLTVAGFTSMLKGILAMRHGVIPATPGLNAADNPAPAARRIVTARQPWPATTGPRRAGVSAFGFGGTNAHLVLAQPGAGAVAGPEPVTPVRLAVTGAGARIGAVAGTGALRRVLRSGRPAFVARPEKRWYGADSFTGGDGGEAGYVDEIDVDVRTYRLPPAELRQANPQHLLLFEAAGEALADAGFAAPKPGARSQDGSGRRVGVVVAMEMEPRSHAHRARFDIGAHVRAECARTGVDLTVAQLERLEQAVRAGVHDPIGANEVLSYIGNIMASRISSAYNLTGPAFTVSTDATAGARALEVAALLLLDPTVEAVLVGGVELAAGVENTLVRAHLGDASAPLGDGAAALVVTRAGAGDRVTVDASVVQPRESGLPAGPAAGDVGLLLLATPAAATDLTALAGLYADRGAGVPGCAVSDLPALVGDTQHGSVLGAAVAAVLSLRHAELPAAPESLRAVARTAEGFGSSALRLLDGPRPWLRTDRDGRRVAAVHAAGAHQVASVVLSAPGLRDATTATDWTGGRGPLLLPLHGDDGPALAEEARTATAALDAGRDPAALVREHTGRPRTGRFTAVLVADGGPALRRELEAAARHLPETVGAGRDWATPAGSYCTARPVGGEGKVAFVYPGAFTSYPGAGQDLFSLFPGLLADFEQESARPWERFKYASLYPSAPLGLDRGAQMRHESELIESIPAMLAIGTNLAMLSTRLLRDVLGITPHGGFGYSLGESSMLFAMNVWATTARDDTALLATPLFRDELRGPKRLVRRTWQLPETTADKDVWSTQVLLAPAADVRAAMHGLDRIHLTHVNTPGEVVVAGAPGQCRELIARLGCKAAKAPANHVMHGSIVEPERAELARLNDYPLGTPAAGLELLSSYDYGPVDLTDRKRIADRISHTLCTTVDFARLATTAYERGFRYFIEIGPGATCTRWVSETLAGRDHVAVSVDRRGVSTGTALAQALAKLVSHGFPVRLERLFAAGVAAGRPAFTATVSCGGESVVDRVAREATPVLAAIREQKEARVLVTAGAKRTSTLTAPTSVVTAHTGPGGLPDRREPDAVTIEGVPFVFLPARTSPRTAPAVKAPQEPPTGRRATPPAAPAAVPTGNGSAAPALSALTAMGSAVARAHQAFLATQQVMLENALADLEAGPAGSVPPPPRPELPPLRPGPPTPADLPRPPKPDGVIWDETDLLEFATGSVAKVFGPDFAEIDTYPVRVRLPEPPYHFVTRVTDLQATTGEYVPSAITTEYDVPVGAWYSVDGLVPCAVTIEAGQCDLLLISYLGIDFRNRGERVYRLLDSELVFHGGLPREGQTLRYEIKIDRFVWNGDTLLFFFNYRCFADGELILELLNACAGFFAAAELEDSLGVVTSVADRKRREAMTPSWFTPLERTSRTSLTGDDLELLAQGRPGDVFGPAWDQTADGSNPSIKLPGAMLRMIDEVTSIDRLGGVRKLGELTAIKYLDPEGWYFQCHFTGDPVLAGSLVAEGGVQLLQTYAMYLGLHLVLPDAEFQSVPGLKTQVKVRGQITPGTADIRYHVEITEITMLPRPTLTADIIVYDGDKPIISMRDFGIQVREKPGTPYRPEEGGIPAFLGRRNAAGEPAFINELHLAHAAKGDLATAMGREFEVYANSRAPYIPNGDFRFVDRIMKFDGVRGVLKPGSTMETEYDCPPEAWYFHENAFPGMPNCVYMESSLQAAILLGYYQGATLATPDEELSIRNLDGHARVVSDVDLRGKTIRQRSKLTFHQAMPGTVLQKFTYELFAGGELFYAGESLFGYHSTAALSTQVGLDAGKYVPPWLDVNPSVAARALPVRTDDRWFEPAGGGLKLAGGHLRLVDEVQVVDGGGKHGRGYLRGTRRIDHDDWYFFCHFYRDPVMPGSLGVEAIIQALQVYAIDSGVAGAFSHPVFAMPEGVEMTWKYRGQILRTDAEMIFDLHVKDIRRTDGRIVITADANVWKPGLRIYELTDVAVEIREDAHRKDEK